MKIKIYLLTILFIFVLPIVSHAEEVEEGSGFLGFDTSSPCAYWQSVFNFGMMAAGILATAMLVFGGIYYMASLGQEDRITNAKNIMTGAVVGFIIAISSWLIFNLLSPTLLECRLEVPQLDLPNVDSDSSDSDSTTTANTCAGVSEDDLYDTQEACMEGWDGSCIQQEVATGDPGNTACTSNDQCEEGQTCEGANSESGESGTCTGGEDDEEEGEGSESGRRWCRIPSASELWREMQSVCSSSGDSLENYRNVVGRWRDILPGQAVYVGGGTMPGGTCHASYSDSYLERKLQGSGYRSQWVDPVDGNIEEAVSNYRAWAESLGGRYCGDCLTFSRELYRCAGTSVNVIQIKESSSSAVYQFDNPREFVEQLQGGRAEMTAGSFIWLGGDCGHAINYTGISGAEVIEMGGGASGGNRVEANGHTATSVRITSTLESYLSSGWVSNRSNCPVYVHRPLEN